MEPQNLISLIKQDPKIKNLFRIQYPELVLEQLKNSELLQKLEFIFNDSLDNILKKNFLDITKNNQKNVIQQRYENAVKYIPEMMLDSNLITITGKINKMPIKIMLDTGSTENIIFKSKIVELSLENYIDMQNNIAIKSINDNNTIDTIGTIWYEKLKLDTIDKEEVEFDLNLRVLNDIELKNDNFDMILGLNFMKMYDMIINFKDNIIMVNNKKFVINR